MAYVDPSLRFSHADDEEDRVAISSDVELSNALEMYNGTMLRLLIKGKVVQPCELSAHTHHPHTPHTHHLFPSILVNYSTSV